MILFYQEPNGDFLNIVSDQFYVTRLVNHPTDFQRIYDGRATAIAELPTSMCTTGVGSAFLKTCKRVAKRAVPQEWLRWMEWETNQERSVG